MCVLLELLVVLVEAEEECGSEVCWGEGGGQEQGERRGGGVNSTQICRKQPLMHRLTWGIL